mmetsp:Transcript_5789/g.9422  ORF Transcript_5789/g.9422 Transcript_5789/m.9422 type:complete len:213 (+) Transcript_5789:1244-1882(+)
MSTLTLVACHPLLCRPCCSRCRRSLVWYCTRPSSRATRCPPQSPRRRCLLCRPHHPPFPLSPRASLQSMRHLPHLTCSFQMLPTLLWCSRFCPIRCRYRCRNRLTVVHFTGNCESVSTAAMGCSRLQTSIRLHLVTEHWMTEHRMMEIRTLRWSQYVGGYARSTALLRASSVLIRTDEMRPCWSKCPTWPLPSVAHSTRYSEFLTFWTSSSW